MKKAITILLIFILFTISFTRCSKGGSSGTTTPPQSYFLNYNIDGQKGTYTKKVFGSRTKTTDGRDMIQIDCVGDNDNADNFTIVVTGDNLNSGTFNFTYDPNQGPQETIWLAKETSAVPTYWTYFTACDGTGEHATTGSITISSAASDANGIEGSFTGFVAPYTTTCGPTFKSVSGTFKAKRIQ